MMKKPETNLSDPANCLCFNLRKAARSLTQIYDVALKAAGITAPQFALLAALKRREPVSLSDLAAGLGLDRTTLTRNLTPLQRDGLVASGEGEDRRVRLLTLTARGRDRLAQAEPLWRAVQSKVTGAFGHRPADNLLGELTRISGTAG